MGKFQDFLNSPAAMDVAMGLLASDPRERMGTTINRGLLAYQAGQQARADQQKQAEMMELDRKHKEALINQANAAALRSAAPTRQEVPSSVREWEYFNKLTPENQQRYLTMKRQEQFLNLGGSYVQPTPGVPGKPAQEFKKTLPPEQRPETKGLQAEETAKGKIRGSAEGQAIEDLPKIISQTEETINLVDQMLSHPGMKQAVGKSSLLQIQKIPGTEAFGFMKYLDQLKGKQFMQAYQTLKGGGQITEVEGKKATDAMSRMDNALSEEEFIKASNDFKEVLVRGVARAKKKAKVDEIAPMRRNNSLGEKAKAVLRKYNYGE